MSRRRRTPRRDSSSAKQDRWLQVNSIDTRRRSLGFERLEQKILLAADFGDAPTPYWTLLLQNGASHETVGPTLGMLRDADVDGNPSTSANGEGVDDDGVVFGDVQVGKLAAVVTVNVQHAPAGARLDAWIDLNGDGSWTSVGEQVFDGMLVVDGENLLTFDVPSWAVAGPTYARFRLSSDGELGPGGPAADGEVEDYLVNILPPEAASGRFIGPQILGDAIVSFNPALVRAVDMDRDGDQDVVGALANGDLFWYENRAAQPFLLHTVTSGAVNLSGLDVADVDADGDIDLLTSAQNGAALWWENNGSQAFAARTIAPADGSGGQITTADLDGDGDLDVLGTSTFDAVLRWYENDGQQHFIAHTIGSPFQLALQQSAVDMDGDGDLDIVGTQAGKSAWYQNNGAQQFQVRLAGSVYTPRTAPADLNDDGRMDIVEAQGDAAYWLRNNGANSFTRIRLASTSGMVSGVADLDGDGDLDVHLTNGWISNDGGSFSWNKFVDLDYAVYSTDDAVAADLDGDGDLDVVGRSSSSGKLAWFENVDNAVTITPPTSVAAEESSATLIYEFRRTGSVARPLSVSFAVSGVAKLGVDYTVSGADSYSTVGGVIQFPAGVNAVYLTLHSIDDADIELDEPIRLKLLSGDGYIVVEPYDAVGVITSAELAGDFGDAPAPYPTTIAQNGARHEASGPILGATRDLETEGSPSLAADGDGADEEGVAFSALRVGQQSAAVTVTVQNAAAGALLDAWIDFNGDGAWDVADERVFASQPVVNGSNLLTFAIPPTSRIGTTYARFRLSSHGQLGPSGVGANGEVEDYEISILPPQSATGQFLAPKLIASLNAAEDLAFADIDGDGDADAVSGTTAGDDIYWFERRSDGSYLNHPVGIAKMPVSIKPVDMDGDGDIDVLSADYHDNRLFWYENLGGGSFGGSARIVGGQVYARDVVPADFDGDGDVDVFAVGRYDGLKWFVNDGSQTFVERRINDPPATQSVHAADVDRDGLMDVIIAGFGKIYWAKSDGTGQFDARLLWSVAPSTHGYIFDVQASDIDDDGDLDLAFGYHDRVAWLENDGAESFTLHVISGAAAVNNWVARTFPVDIDGDGDVDIAAMQEYGNKLTWFENDGDQHFSAKVVDSSSGTLHSMTVVDVDGDGDLDLATTSYHQDSISWYENIDAAVSLSLAPSSISEGGVDSLIYTFTRATGLQTPLTVNFTVAGSASFGTDYISSGATFTGASGKVTIPAGVASVEVRLTPVNDSLFEFDEAVSFTLSAGADYVVTTPAAVTGVIVSDDFADLGDAPAPYPTTAIENGPVHMPFGPTLGATRDAEANGAHSSAADADGADEDGVSFGTLRVGQTGATLTVNVRNAPAQARLDAWIDFNRDGSWGGPGEQIADNFLVVEGDNLLSIDVPSHIDDGFAFARFRLSTAGGLAWRGGTADGEVEDYRVMILPPKTATQAFWARDIATGVDGAESVKAADVDGDGDLDLVTASFLNDTIAWYENDGAGQFVVHVVSTVANGARSAIAADVDGDGDLDLVSASSLDNKICWYENDGSQSFTARTVNAQAQRAMDVFAADVDGDGDVDLLSASYSDDKIAWYENNGNQVFAARIITTAADGASSVTAADLDGDGDLDVASASALDDRIVWYRNDGQQAFTAVVVTTQADGAMSVFAADVNGDGAIDLLSASKNDNRLFWYRRNSSGSYTPRLISSSLLGVSSVATGDVDGDGDSDVLFASRNDDRVGWFQNVGNETFLLRLMSRLADSARSVIAADLDGDGDLDIASASYSDDRLTWYENADHADFGDAPAPYPTSSLEGGAVHLPIGPTLGALRDAEANGSHTNSADGDGTDDDGVTFGVISAGQIDAELSIEVQNAPGGARLDAWFDFNGDGSWGGAGEYVFQSVLVGEGNNLLKFDVPALVVPGQIFARFRLSIVGRLAPGGPAVDGEVEDYAVTVAPPAASGGVFGSLQTAALGLNGATMVRAADIDGDGDMDLVTASSVDWKLAWHENAGNQTFVTRVVANNVSGAADVHVVDMDRDGDLDLLVAAGGDTKVVWYENSGGQVFVARTAGTGFNNPNSLVPGDFDGDGDTDFIAQSRSNSGLRLFENDGAQNFISRTITTTSGPGSIRFADMDSDGDLDIVTCNGQSGWLSWFENREGVYGVVSRTIAFSSYAKWADAIDVDGDGDVDVVAAFSGSPSSGKLSWCENLGGGQFTEHIVAPNVRGASANVADMDGDGDLDLLSASYSDDAIVWYVNNGSQSFTPRTVGIGVDGANSVTAADIEGDGDLDIVATSFIGDRVVWFRNSPVGDFNRDTMTDGADFLLWQRTFGGSVTSPSQGADGNANGQVDLEDLAIWREAYGSPAVSSSAFSAIDARALNAPPVETETQLSMIGVDGLHAPSLATLSAPTQALPLRRQATPPKREVAVDEVFARQSFWRRSPLVSAAELRRQIIVELPADRLINLCFAGDTIERLRSLLDQDEETPKLNEGTLA